MTGSMFCAAARPTVLARYIQSMAGNALSTACIAVFLLCFCPQVVSAVDSDSDGMPDDWEIAHGLDPHNAADAFLDPDQDGFPNLLEYLLGADPTDGESRGTLADNQSKIIGYWSLVTNAVDLVGRNDGEPRNGAKFTNSVLVLNGRGAYVNFGNDSSLSVTGSISLCVWIQPPNKHGLVRLLGKFQAAQNQREYAVFLGADNSLWTFFSDDGSQQSGRSILLTTPRLAVKNSQWQHVAVTWDCARGADGVAVYVNGTPLPMRIAVDSDMSALYSGNANLTLGSYDIVYSAKRRKEVVANSFPGSMARLALCRGALTAEEVKEIWLQGLSGDLRAYLNMDFDHDGMPDWWERKHFGDLSHSAQEDSDHDGLSNIDEYRHGMDPLNPDTDGDGVLDGPEVNPPPPDMDSDGDGLPDWWELKYFGNLNQSGADDPDGDGWNNLSEYKRGGHPMRPWVNDANDTLKLRVKTPVR